MLAPRSAGRCPTSGTWTRYPRALCVSRCCGCELTFAGRRLCVLHAVWLYEGICAIGRELHHLRVATCEAKSASSERSVCGW
jgi:hypothetical protein